MEELQQKNEYETQQLKTDMIEKHEKVIAHRFFTFSCVLKRITFTFEMFRLFGTYLVKFIINHWVFLW